MKIAVVMLLAVTVSSVTTNQASGQLEPALNAHGGLAKWKNFGAVEYDLVWSGSRGEKRDHQLFDLRSRDGLITAENYSLGGSFAEVWVKPNAEAVGMPPRFYLWTPFYFFGMPFVFADPGAKAESLGQRTLGDKTYDVVRITYEKGVGDSPDDYYLAHFDSESDRLALVAYIVTYPALAGGKPPEGQQPHAIVFEEWQEAGGLIVPKTGKLYDWANDNIAGEGRGTLTFSNVRFSEESPNKSKFAKPADAVVAPLE